MRERNYGFPQEMQHFVDRGLNGTPPLETGEDCRAVLEVILAACERAGTGRRVESPNQGQIGAPSGGSLTLVSYDDAGRHEEQVPYLDSDWFMYWRDLADHLLRGGPVPYK